jgi:hypothetical protein
MASINELKEYIDEGNAHALQANMGAFDARGYQKLLRYCVECDQVACLKVMAQYCDPNVTTALLRSAQYGHLECVAFLIPSTCSEYDAGVALVNAASYGRLECVKIMAPYCTLYFCEQALIEANERKHIDIAQWLEHDINCRQNKVLHDSVVATHQAAHLRKI